MNAVEQTAPKLADLPPVERAIVIRLIALGAKREAKREAKRLAERAAA